MILEAVDFWTLAFSGMTAVGTVAVAVLAVFGQRIRARIMQPRISVSAGDKPPLLEVVDLQEESSSSSKRPYAQIRLRVVNSGLDTARGCVAVCHRVYAESADRNSYFVDKELVPQQFFWANGTRSVDVIPRIPTYINVVQISTYEELTDGLRPTSSDRPSAALQVQVEDCKIEGRFINISHKRIVVPIILYASNLPKPLTHYLEVSWDGKSQKDFSPDQLRIRLLSSFQEETSAGGQG